MQAADPSPDRTQELLRRLVEQLSLPLQAGSPLDSPTDDQSQLIASQAAALASARQAMQLMLQLLESGGDLSQLFESGAQTAEHAGTQPGQQAAGTQDLLSQLVQQLSASQAAATPPGIFQDQSEQLAAQAAELASARQAMQLMLQLLEQQQAPQDAVAGHQTPAQVARQEAQQAAVQEPADPQLQQALQSILAGLEAQPAMASNSTSVQPAMQVAFPCTFQKSAIDAWAQLALVCSAFQCFLFPTSTTFKLEWGILLV